MTQHPEITPPGPSRYDAPSPSRLRPRKSGLISRVPILLCRSGNISARPRRERAPPLLPEGNGFRGPLVAQTSIERLAQPCGRGRDVRARVPANEHVQRRSSPYAVAPDSACHAGGRGFDQASVRMSCQRARILRVSADQHRRDRLLDQDLDGEAGRRGAGRALTPPDYAIAGLHAHEQDAPRAVAVVRLRIGDRVGGEARVRVHCGVGHASCGRRRTERSGGTGIAPLASQSPGSGAARSGKSSPTSSTAVWTRMRSASGVTCVGRPKDLLP